MSLSFNLIRFKYVCSFCGFDNALIFKNITDDDIDYVEIYMKTHNFNEFLNRGHKKTVKEIVAYVSEVVDGNGLSYFKNDAIKEISNEKPFEQLIETVNECFSTRTHYLLNKLLSTASQNATRQKGGYRYDKVLNILQHIWEYWPAR